MLNIKDVKSIRLRANQLLITMNRYDKDFKTKSGYIKFPKGMMKNYQEVVCISPMVERSGDVKVGDTIMLNPNGYARVYHEWQEEEMKKAHKDINDVETNIEAAKDKMAMLYSFDEVKVNGKTYAVIYDNDIKYIVDSPEEFEYAPD